MAPIFAGGLHDGTRSNRRHADVGDIRFDVPRDRDGTRAREARRPRPLSYGGVIPGELTDRAIVGVPEDTGGSPLGEQQLHFGGSA